MQKFIILIFILISLVLYSEESIPLSKTVTPNNDGKNDTFIYKCYNPYDFNVTGEIFDLYGKKISDMKIIDQNRSDYYYILQWIPPKNIKGGIYIYQIIVGKNKHRGTFLIIK